MWFYNTYKSFFSYSPTNNIDNPLNIYPIEDDQINIENIENKKEKEEKEDEDESYDIDVYVENREVLENIEILENIHKDELYVENQELDHTEENINNESNDESNNFGKYYNKSISLFYKFPEKEYQELRSILNIQSEKKINYLYKVIFSKKSNQILNNRHLKKYDLLIKHINYCEKLIKEGKAEYAEGFGKNIIHFYIKWYIDIDINKDNIFEDFKNNRNYINLINQWNYLYNLLLNFLKFHTNQNIQEMEILRNNSKNTVIENLQNIEYILEINKLYEIRKKEFAKSLSYKNLKKYRNFQKETNKSIFKIDLLIKANYA